MVKKIVFDWELVSGDEKKDILTYRCRTIGGWLVKTIVLNSNAKPVSSNLLFIADRDYEWQPIEPYVEPEKVKKDLAKDFESPAAMNPS